MATNVVTLDKELTVTLNAYTAGDVVGGLLTFSLGSANPRGFIRHVALIDEDSQAETYTLYLYDAQPSTIANDAAFAPTVADLRKIIGTVALASASYVTVNTFDYILSTGLSLPFAATGGSLYAYLVATDTPDYANADTLFLRITAELL